MVTVITGPVRSAVGVNDKDLPRVVTDWANLVSLHFEEDCRGVLQIRDETESERVYERLGYRTPGEFYRKELDLDPELIVMACGWLGENPGRTAGFEQAAELGQHGGARAKGEQETNSSLKTGSTMRDYTLARLKRDNPALAEQVVKGELTANAAAIQAGFRHPMIQVRADDLAAAIAKLNKHYGVELWTKT